MSLVSPQSRKTRRSWRIRFLSQRKVTMKHKVLVSFPIPNIFLYNTLLQPNVTTRGRSYGAKVRRCPWATWEIRFRSDEAASRPHRHYFMFLYPRTSLPPLYKYGSKGETTSARSVHCFITSETKTLVFELWMLPPYPCFTSTATRMNFKTSIQKLARSNSILVSRDDVWQFIYLFQAMKH